MHCCGSIRPFIPALVEYGEKQDFDRTANYSSSCGAGSAKYYADKTGKKPVIFIVGAIHATELEGTSVLLNLIQIIEAGKITARIKIFFCQTA
ncbi:MAG: hypothetical protein LBH43_08675 [Treponema sp.]|jgi:predicted deacylase|nr:hypothetical protein [Treponema sp.]